MKLQEDGQSGSQKRPSAFLLSARKGKGPRMHRKGKGDAREVKQNF